MVRASNKRLRSFARELLRAFASTDSYACERLGARSSFLDGDGWSIVSRSGQHVSSSSFGRRPSRSTEACAMMRRVHSICVTESILALCNVLGVDEDVSNPVVVALGDGDSSTDTDRNNDLDWSELMKCLEAIECNFLGVSRALTRSKSNRAWVADYRPDWRTRNLVWELVKGLGKITPPDECIVPFKRIKEATFAALFQGDYLIEQRKRSSFKQTLLKHFPYPNAWDASLGWLALSFFVSIPLANIAHNLEGSNRLRAFWGTFALIFVVTSTAYVLLSSKYSSHYAKKLLDRAAAGMASEDETSYSCEEQTADFSNASYSAATNAANMLSRRYTKMQLSGLAGESSVIDSALEKQCQNSNEDCSCVLDADVENSRGQDVQQINEISDAGEHVLTVQENMNVSEGGSDVSSSKDICVNFVEPRKTEARAPDTKDEDLLSSGLLRLYQVSMLIERMFGSSYFDDQWAIGLTEDRLYDAIIQILTSDIALGQQFAAFSFTAVAISSKGTSLGPGSDAVSASGVRFSFGLFGLLAASGFLCGLTSSILADFMLRKIALTQTKDERTSHEFAAEFGFYLRVTGGLNGFAGMFLATAIFHFLLSIFRVSPVAAVLLAAIWLLAGSVLMESFIASFTYWSLNEVFDDLGEFVDPPDRQSPNPVTGSMQMFFRWLNHMTSAGRSKGD